MNIIQLIAKPLSALGLALILIVPILYFTASVGASTMQNLMLTGTVLWFLSAPLWVKSDRGDSTSI